MARAALMGIPATIELIERLPPRMWPSWMVVEPEDAAALAAMVGRRTQFHQATQPVVVAQPQLLSGRMQLNALDAFGLPRGNMGVAGAGTNLADTLLVDAVDLVDVVSERAHAVTRGATFVQGRVLDDLAVGRELFDAGYLLTAGQGLCARLNIPVDGARLVIRTVVDAPITFRTTLSATGCGSEQDGSEQGTWHATTRLASSPGWSEPILEVPPLAQLPLQAMEEGTLWIEWSAEHGELPLFHVWVLSKARNP